jgi:hypothetical protein
MIKIANILIKCHLYNKSHIALDYALPKGMLIDLGYIICENINELYKICLSLKS